MSCLFLVASCASDIPFTGLERGAVPVVNGLLTPDTVQVLSLTRSSSSEQGWAFAEIAEADAVLFEDSVEVGRYVRESYERWVLHFTPTAGKRYRLAVLLPDGTTVSAETRMPEEFPVDGLSDDEYHRGFRQGQSLWPCWFFALQSDSVFFWFTDNSRVRLVENIGTNHPAVDAFNLFGSMTEVSKDLMFAAHRFCGVCY
ncbi:MAG: DUF4249 domain-containing protein [Bacteroidales bacterium]|nr:DUF4249 domain-containing protein [Bacteroidales bacterium]